MNFFKQSLTPKKSAEALLVIVTGFLVLYLVFQHKAFLYVSLSVGLISVFIKPLGNVIARFWFILGEILGFFVSKIVLTLLFYLFLTPIALVHNLFNKDVLKTKNRGKTLWSERSHKYASKDFENIW